MTHTDSNLIDRGNGILKASEVEVAKIEVSELKLREAANEGLRGPIPSGSPGEPFCRCPF